MSAEAQQPKTVTLLLEFPFQPDSEAVLANSLNAMLAELEIPASHVSAWVATSAAVATCYIAAPNKLADLGRAAEKYLARLATGSIETSRLQLMARHAGASHSAQAGFHYVVRTDVMEGGDAELVRWYDEEHMAMLAAVPGTVAARRFVSLDAAPRYYACYDLMAPSVLQSDAWLRVRQTPWSQRVRPTFTNTRRVISRRLDLPDLQRSG